MGTCSIHSNKQKLGIIIPQEHIKQNTLTAQENAFLTCLFNELCVRNYAKGHLEINTFLMAFEFKGILGEAIFSHYDEDKDGYINLEAFMKTITCLVLGTLKTVSNKLFDIFDFNQDGLITKKNFTNILGPLAKEKMSLIRPTSSLFNLNATDHFSKIYPISTKSLLYLEEPNTVTKIFDKGQKETLSKQEFADLLSQEIWITELIKEKFLYKYWKGVNIHSFLSNYDDFTEVTILIKGKIKKRFLILSEKFLILLEENKRLENVLLLENCLAKSNKTDLYFSYLSFSESRIFSFKTEDLCRYFQDSINRFSGLKHFKKCYRTLESVGSGKFSEVFLIEDLVDESKHAVKVINKRVMNKIERDLIRSEIQIMIVLKHPGIIQLREVFESKRRVKIVMEYANGTDLFNKMKQGKLEETKIKKIIKRLLEIIEYIHDSGVIHRDIKPENIIIFEKDQDFELKILDFGLSTFFRPKEKKKCRCGTLGYSAPEIYYGEYNEKVDIWSVGVITYAYLTGKLPFFSYSNQELIEKTKYDEVVFDEEEWLGYSKSSQDFTSWLLEKNPLSRPSSSQALNHEWFSTESSFKNT